jgi:hypothetical protein
MFDHSMFDFSLNNYQSKGFNSIVIYVESFKFISTLQGDRKALFALYASNFVFPAIIFFFAPDFKNP